LTELTLLIKIARKEFGGQKEEELARRIIASNAYLIFQAR
jgi:hypothetical protein